MSSPRDVLHSFTKAHDGDRRQLVDDAYVDGVSDDHPVEVSELQLNESTQRSHKASQEGLKVVIISSICFAISVTVALIITIYFGPPQVPTHAGVVSDNQDCSDLGAKLLKKGGSAMDAAVATSLCVGIVNPETSGIGGGGALLVHSHKSGVSHVIDFMGSVPARWSNQFKQVGQSVSVPGMLRGLESAHNKFGKLSWKDVILSVKDFVDSRIIASQNSSLTTMSGLTTTDGTDVRKVSGFLGQLAEKGSKVFYEGEMGQDVINLANKAGGNIDKLDMKQYEVTTTKPVSSTFYDMTVETTGAPSDGPILLLMLNIIENITMDNIVPMNSTELSHYIVEGMKFAYAERISMNDPQNLHAMENITEQLISKEYASFLASRIDRSKTYNADYYLTMDHLDLSDFIDPSAGSSHVAVIGPADDIVSVTLSLNDEKGSGLRTPAGFYLNNHIKNGKIFEPVAPAIVYKTNSPCGQRLAIGAAHGNFSAAGLAEVLFSMVSQSAEIKNAVGAGRLYVDVTNDITVYEETIQPSVASVLDMLRDKGHINFVALKADNIRINVASKLNEVVSAYADPRNVKAGNAVF